MPTAPQPPNPQGIKVFTRWNKEGRIHGVEGNNLDRRLHVGERRPRASPLSGRHNQPRFSPGSPTTANLHARARPAPARRRRGRRGKPARSEAEAPGHHASQPPPAATSPPERPRWTTSTSGSCSPRSRRRTTDRGRRHGPETTRTRAEREDPRRHLHRRPRGEPVVPSGGDERGEGGGERRRRG